MSQKIFPYKFVKRKESGKTEITAFHDELLDNNFDVAFDITWTTKTAAALNPCTDDSQPESCPSGNEGEYAGYNKRWLMTDDNRLAISPFTVKSAVANGFANIVGSCYRVISKVEGHPKEVNTGTYYYNGKYKRYRVDRRNSEPGIIKNIEDVEYVVNSEADSNKDKIKRVKRITIQPIQEYHLRDSGSFEKGKKYYGISNKSKVIKILKSVPRKADGKKQKYEVELHYDGPYAFGMNAELRFPELGTKCQHRFYSILNQENKSKKAEIDMNNPFAAAFASKPIIKAEAVKKDNNLIIAEIDALNFQTADELKKKVYMGNFFNGDTAEMDPSDPRRDRIKVGDGGIWYEDLSTLKVGDWVYYQIFPNHPENIVENIGKNFQFKALFCHEDTVPEGFEECKDINRLCPRCRLFGMTGETYNNTPDTNNNKTVKALKGRFKASTLVSDIELTQETQNSQIPFLGGNESNFRSVTLNLWKDKNSPERVISKQLFLPLQASPKPNKRDVDGYFDKQTGDMKGAKIYIDERKRFEKLEDAENNYIKDKIDSNRKLKDDAFEYAHHLRNYAQVCESNLNFKGVVGIDNGDKDEIAALIMLLETGLGGHAFKIGLGKAFGMGAVESKINKIWIRSNQDYTWKQYEIGKKEDLTEIKSKIGIDKELENFKQVTEAIKQQTLMQNNEELYYPAAGLKYWSEAKVKTVIL